MLVESIVCFQHLLRDLTDVSQDTGKWREFKTAQTVTFMDQQQSLFSKEKQQLRCLQYKIKVYECFQYFVSDILFC